MRRFVVLAVAGVILAGAPASPSGAATTACSPRLLVLSAFPAEIGGILDAATVTRTEVIDGRSFFLGRLEGNDVVMALTGIGQVNATRTTEEAFAHFGCGSGHGITGVVFSGVSGGRTYIGDVTVANRWTQDGKHWLGVDPSMFATSRRVAQSGSVKLERNAPIGDCGCTGLNPDLVPTVRLDRAPRIVMGGDGHTADPFGGRAFPCISSGGDVFGCDPCRFQSHSPDQVSNFLTGAAPFIDPNFFASYFASPPASTSTYTADDMETAAVARVAAQHGAPFLAFRALSDGKGDPLMLPGFPFQFFVYRQLAADNAAAVALAFLKAWGAKATA
jgi:nucleoside phosphorylase